MGIPLVALAGEPLPEPKSILTSAAQAGQVQGQDIQNQQGQLQLQQQQQDLKDQKAMTDALKDWDGQSYEDLAKQVVRNGGSGKAALAVEQHGIQVKTAMMGLNTQQLANLQTKHDLALGELSGADKVPDAQLPQYVMNSVQKLTSNGTLTPQEGQEFAGLTQLPPDQLRTQLGIHEASLRGEKAQLAATQSQAQTEEANQKAAQAKAEAEAAKFKESGGVLVNTQTGNPVMNGAALSPAALEMKYDEAMFKKYQGQPLTADDQAAIKTFEHKKEIVPVVNFNLQNSGAAADSGGGPSQIAQAIASGNMSWKDAVSPRTPMSTKNAILSQVFKLNPNFDTAEFGLEQDAAKKARSGAWADTRLAYNTAIDHSQQLLQTIDALNNGDVKTLNSMKNFFKTEFGSADVPNFQAVANAYNHEVTSVVSKGHITDAEVAQGGSVLPPNASPQQLRGVVAQYQGLMKSKRDELDKIIKGGAGSKANGIMDVQSGNQGTDPFAQFGGKPR